MDYQPLITTESKVLPDVRFTLRRMSVARRAKFNLGLAEYHAQVRDIRRERRPLDKKYSEAFDAARKAADAEVDRLITEGKTREEAEAAATLKLDLAEDTLERLAELIAQDNRANQDVLAPAMLRVMFVGIEGFTIEGKVPAVDELIEEGPTQLLDEIASAADRIMGLGAADSGNLPSPGTSPQPEAGQANSTDASTAAPAA